MLFIQNNSLQVLIFTVQFEHGYSFGTLNNWKGPYIYVDKDSHFFKTKGSNSKNMQGQTF